MCTPQEQKEPQKGQKIPIPLWILGASIFMASIINILNLWPHFEKNIYVFIVICFALVALVMNYTNNGTERNAWDVWFFAMPGAVVALLIFGVLGEDHFSEVWKWVAIALGTTTGFGSIGSIIGNLKEKKEK